MGYLKGGRGVVVVIRLMRRSQARCTSGWIGKTSLVRPSAAVGALIDAAQNDCDPATPLYQPGADVPSNPPDSPKADSPTEPKSNG
jgi:hypothetical protein